MLGKKKNLRVILRMKLTRQHKCRESRESCHISTVFPMIFYPQWASKLWIHGVPEMTFKRFKPFFSSVEAARKVLEWRNKGRFCGRYRVARRTSPKMFSLPYVTRGSLSSVCGKPYEAELPSLNIRPSFHTILWNIVHIQVSNCLKTIVQSISTQQGIT